MDIVGGILGLVDSLSYTDQEKARDETAKVKAIADAEAAKASIRNAELSVAKAEENADLTKTLALYGLGAIGVIVLGFVVYTVATKKK